jgi:4'-phosphopantetheinyl transferase
VQSMNTYLLEQREDTVAPGNAWLSLVEIASLNAMRFAKRRADWRLGRWTAKHAVALCLNLPESPAALAKIEIIPNPSGAPEAFLSGARLPVTISISHRAGTAICAVAPPDVQLGCDLELIEAHSPGFVTDFFTAEEQTLVAHLCDEEQRRILTLLWSAKESALKALQEGLRRDTRSVSITNFSGEWDVHGWRPLQVRDGNCQILHGWWQANDWILRTLVAEPSPDSPIVLDPAMQSDEIAARQFPERQLA